MRTLLLLAALGMTVVVGFAAPAMAGTCMQVGAKGEANNVAKATALAQASLQDKAKRRGGKVTQATTNCVPGPAKTVCKISAVVCPK
jgi:hypothetical protein